MANISLFGQIIQRIDRSIFNKLVKKHQTDKHQKGFNSWSHLISMLFCHLVKSESLRDINYQSVFSEIEYLPTRILVEIGAQPTLKPKIAKELFLPPHIKNRDISENIKNIS